MIYAGSKLQVSDNSGVKLVKCLKVLGRRPRSYGKVGDIIVVNIQRIKTFSKIKKKDIYKAVIIRLKKKKMRIDGSLINFGKNSVVLLNNKGFPLATRVFGPVSKELRVKKFLKLASLCPKML